MGAELSKEELEDFRREDEEKYQRLKGDTRRTFTEEDWKRINIVKAKRDGKIAPQTEATSLQAESPQPQEDEPPSPKQPKEKPRLVRSSKGDAPIGSAKRTHRQPFNIEDPEEDQDQDQDPLSKWQPRKEPLNKAQIKRERSSSGDFLGFGHETPTVTEQDQAPKGAPLGSKGAASRAKNDGAQAPKKGTSQSHADDSAEKADGRPGGPPSKPKVNTNVRPVSASTSSAESSASASTKPKVNTNFRSASTSSSAKSPEPASAKPSAPVLASSKRSATSAFADERRSGASNSNKIPKRSSDASPLSPNEDAPKKKKASTLEKEAVTSLDERPPAWYKKLNFMNSRDRNQSTTAPVLENLKDEIKRAQDPRKMSNVATTNAVFDKLRRLLHTVPFQLVTEQLLRNNRLLHNDDGLPFLFDKKMELPYDIRADAEELYNKWCQKEFETDLLHHISRGGPGEPQGKIDPTFRKSSKFFGNGLLLNGQWWPLQIAAMRDGAHGETIKGISSGSEGAYSCIISGGQDSPYDNKNGDGNDDRGDVVLYCGMDSDNGVMTANTKSLMLNEKNNKPVRFIRSHKCPGEWSPEIGFRYDGLYKVVSHEVIDPPASIRQRVRFKLVRRKGQDPIRGGAGPEKRPTTQEMEVRSDMRNTDTMLRYPANFGGIF
jgi:hypothetical protein